MPCKLHFDSPPDRWRTSLWAAARRLIGPDRLHWLNSFFLSYTTDELNFPTAVSALLTVVCSRLAGSGAAGCTGRALSAYSASTRARDHCEKSISARVRP